MGERIGLTDEEWALIGPLLPAEHGRGCRPAQDNRRYFEGMMWLARTGAQWRHLPDDYGKWNSVFRRYRRWLEVGVFDAMLESLAEMVERGAGRVSEVVEIVWRRNLRVNQHPPNRRRQPPGRSRHEAEYRQLVLFATARRRRV